MGVMASLSKRAGISEGLLEGAQPKRITAVLADELDDQVVGRAGDAAGDRMVGLEDETAAWVVLMIDSPIPA